MARQRTRWTQEEIDSFIKWHTERINQLGYPKAMVDQLIKDRTKFLPAPKPTA